MMEQTNNPNLTNECCRMKMICTGKLITTTPYRLPMTEKDFLSGPQSFKKIFWYGHVHNMLAYDHLGFQAQSQFLPSVQLSEQRVRSCSIPRRCFGSSKQIYIFNYDFWHNTLVRYPSMGDLKIGILFVEVPCAVH